MGLGSRVTGFTASTGMARIRILGLWVARTRGLASRASRIQGCWVSGSMDPPDARSVHRKSSPVPSASSASLGARPGSVGFELTGSAGSSGLPGSGYGVDGFAGHGQNRVSQFSTSRTHLFSQATPSLNLSFSFLSISAPLSGLSSHLSTLNSLSRSLTHCCVSVLKEGERRNKERGRRVPLLQQQR